MQHSDAAPDTARLGAAEPGYGAWLAFWGELILLALLAVLGAFFASAKASPGDEVCGLMLSLAAIALTFMRLKHRFDGGDPGWAGFLLVDDPVNLVAVIVVFAILALTGLFVAAGVDHGGLHNAGVALFVTSGIAVFLNLKRVFDNLDRQPGRDY
jgi:hypothetical protein